jgi:hypothetical protein
MICTLTARRLKPESYDQFRAAWDPSQGNPEALRRWTRVYHCRDVKDPDIVISFGLFDGTPAELREAQAQLSRDSQVDRVTPHVQEVLLDGYYDVIEELTH